MDSELLVGGIVSSLMISFLCCYAQISCGVSRALKRVQAIPACGIRQSLAGSKLADRVGGAWGRGGAIGRRAGLTAGLAGLAAGDVM